MKYADFRELALRGDTDTLLALLAHDREVAALRDAGGVTVLHEVVQEGDPLRTRILLRHGASPRWRDSEGVTPMHLARANLVPMLIEAGGVVNERDNQGRTPLIHQVLEDDGLQAMKALMAAGADPGIVDKDGRNARDYARKKGDREKLVLLTRPR